MRITIFFKIFGALFWGPRGSCPLFSNSPSPATYLHIFPDVSTSILTSFFTVLNLLMIGVKVHVYPNLITKNFFKIFSKFFCALFWGPRGSCPLFSNSASPATYPRFFRRFDLFSQFLLHGSAEGLTCRSNVHV